MTLRGTAALAQGFKQSNARRHRNIQSSQASGNRDRGKEIALLADLLAQPVTFGPQHQDGGATQVHLEKVLLAALVQADKPEAAALQILERASQVGDPHHRKVL